MKTINYKGKGEHSVNELELIIEQQAEELHLLKSGQKQLPIHGVVKSLPNKKEMNIELHEQFLEWRKTENGLCRKAFTLGFKQCYYWFKSKETK